MVAPRQFARGVHPLLDHRPIALVGNDERMQINVESILHGGAVDLGDEPTDLAQPRAVDPGPLSNRAQLLRRVTRVTASPAADMDAKIPLRIGEGPLERPDRAGGNSRRMPIHAHHRAKRLEPEGVREPAKKLGAAIL